MRLLKAHWEKRQKKNMLPIQPGDVESTYADTSELMKDFSYKPDTPLDEGYLNLQNGIENFIRYKEVT